MAVPKIIHQLWKNAAVPERYRALAESWRKHHPDWEYRLWTDADIRAFIAREYPSFLSIFDGYRDGICRADAARYLILKSFGGVYADLDAECLRPFDALLDGKQLVFGLEPEAHLRLKKAADRRFDKLLCPTVIASAPGHPFWDHVWRELRAIPRSDDVLDITGPFMLTRVHARYDGSAPVTLLPPEIFYPLSKEDCWTGRAFDIEFWERATRNAYAQHYWDGSWFRDADEDLPPLPESFPISVTAGSERPDTSIPNAAGGTRMISCLMVTRDRFEMSRFALDMFLRQTYANRELIVVDDGDCTRLESEIARLDDSRIRFIRPKESGASLGALRNLAVDEARGDYVCQWDDDDLSDPRRLEVQMAAIVATKSRACFLTSWLIWMPRLNRLVISNRRPWEGSMLCEKAILGRYPEQRLGEDTPVAEEVRRRYDTANLDIPRLYVYTYHGGNTWSDDHFRKFLSAGKKVYAGPRYAAVLQELNKRVPLSAYAASLSETATLPHTGIDGIGVNIFGHLNAGIGFGAAVRGLLAAAVTKNLPHATIDLDELHRRGPGTDGITTPHLINIMHTNPDMLSATFYSASPAGYDDRLFKGRYNIGYWAWESATTLPDAWQPWFDRFDEIWVPSRYVAHCLAPHSTAPIVDMPFMDKAPKPHLSRAQMGLPDGPFLFLCMFDELSGLERKNPLGMIEAFHRAFPEDDGAAGLIVKARSLSAKNLERLKAAACGRSSIEIRVGEMGPGEIASLIAGCDAFLSLHRSEGLGLVLAEAMSLGKPVIATAYSGNLDFMTAETSYLVSCETTKLETAREAYPAGTEWADPDLDHAARVMRAVAGDPEAARATGRRAATHVEAVLGLAATSARMERRLRTIVDKGLVARATARKSAPRMSPDLPPVLILTPVKNAAPYLPRYFDLLASLDYDPANISLGFIEGDSDDATYEYLTARLPALRQRYRRVYLLKQDHGLHLDVERWQKSVQRIRREKLARARNRLLNETLDDEAWVLWLDADLIDYPRDLLRRLLAVGKDIVVPRCVLADGRDYDLNSFRFDPARGPAENPRHLIDGIYQPPKGYGRAYLGDLAGESPAPIDSVGGTALLVRADLHREGLNFPAYSHRGYIETEGLSMMAKDMGYKCWALPDLRIVHVSA